MKKLAAAAQKSKTPKQVAKSIKPSSPAAVKVVPATPSPSRTAEPPILSPASPRGRPAKAKTPTSLRKPGSSKIGSASKKNTSGTPTATSVEIASPKGSTPRGRQPKAVSPRKSPGSTPVAATPKGSTPRGRPPKTPQTPASAHNAKSPKTVYSATVGVKTKTPGTGIAAKTPKLSTAKKGLVRLAGKTPKSGRSAVGGARRPLWSEVVRKNLGKTPKKTSKLVPAVNVAKPIKKAGKVAVGSGKTPRKRAPLSSTGHAQSPEAIVIGRAEQKVQPIVLPKKGRKSGVSTDQVEASLCSVHFL